MAWMVWDYPEPPLSWEREHFIEDDEYTDEWEDFYEDEYDEESYP